MKKWIAILVLTSASAAFASNEVKDALKKQYAKHILVLRTPLQPGDQEFDSTGKPLKEVPANQPRIYGPLLITEIKSESNSLRLEGVRVCNLKSLKPDKNMLLQSGKSVKVKIQLGHPLNSAEEAQAIMDRIFFVDLKQSPYSLPEYRRPDENLGADQKIDHVGSGTAAPQPIFSPDPDFSDQARKAKYQGTVILAVVVDSNGHASRVKLVRALGMGLDERAMEKVLTWQFRPARREGKPVPVEVNVEVSFNWY